MGHVILYRIVQKIVKIWSGGGLMPILGCRKHILLITNVFERKYLISLR